MRKTVLRSKPEENRRSAVTPREWRELCQKALIRARKVGDRRALGLEKAITARNEQTTLQALGIICESDLDREFSPLPT